MKNLTARERLLLVLSGQIPDRVPVSPFVHDEYLSYFYPKETEVDRAYDALELARELGREKQVSDGRIYFRTTIETPKKTLTQLLVGPDAGVASAGVHLSTQEYFLKDQEDMEAFFEFIPDIDSETIAEMNTITSQWSKALGKYGIAGNIANGAIFGSDFFSAHVEPYEKPVIDAIHSHGAYTIYHNCGIAKELYSSYKRMGFTLWETVSEHPVGDNTLQDAKDYFGDSICLLGNLDQVHFLKTASPQEVAGKTRWFLYLLDL